MMSVSINKRQKRFHMEINVGDGVRHSSSPPNSEEFPTDTGISAVKENPLTNSWLLSILFNHLYFHDLKTVRQVCKQWWEISLNRWRSITSFTLVNDTVLFTKRYKTCRNRGFKKFLEMFPNLLDGGSLNIRDLYQLRKKPFQNFRIESATFPPKHRTQINCHKLFLSLCGHGITSLVLFECEFRQNQLVESLKWILNICINLKELKVLYCGVARCSNAYMRREVFEMAPAQNLQLIELKNFAFNEKDDVKEILHFTPNLKTLNIDDNALDLVEGLLDRTETGSFIKLEKLRVLKCATGEDFEEEMAQLLNQYVEIASPLLTELNYKYDLTRSRMPRNRFYDFLECCQDTLTSLTLTIECGDLDSPPSFNDLNRFHFPNLNRLNLIFRFWTDFMEDDFTFDFHMLRGMPNLTVLRCVTDCTKHYGNYNTMMSYLDHLSFQNLRDASISGRPSFHLPKLEEFRFFSRFNSDDFHFLSSAMPKLQQFEIIFDEETLLAALETFPGLRSIILLPGSETNFENERVKRRINRAKGGIKMEVACLKSYKWDMVSDEMKTEMLL